LKVIEVAGLTEKHLHLEPEESILN